MKIVVETNKSESVVGINPVCDVDGEGVEGSSLTCHPPRQLQGRTQIKSSLKADQIYKISSESDQFFGDNTVCKL